MIWKRSRGIGGVGRGITGLGGLLIVERELSKERYRDMSESKLGRREGF